jgi:hypothetical protein
MRPQLASAWATPGGVVPELGPFVTLAAILLAIYVFGVIWGARRLSMWWYARRAAVSGRAPSAGDGRRQGLIAGAVIVLFTFKRMLEVCLFVAVLVAAKLRWL